MVTFRVHIKDCFLFLLEKYLYMVRFVIEELYMSKYSAKNKFCHYYTIIGLSLGPFYQTTWCHFQSVHIQCSENLKPHKMCCQI